MDLRGSQIFLQPGVSPTPLSLFSSAPGFKPQGEMSLHSAEEHLLGGFSSSCVSLLLREGPHCPGSQPRVSEPQKAPGHEAPKGNPKAAPRLRSRLQYPQSYGMLGLTTTLRSLPPDLVPFLHTSGCFVSKRRCPPPRVPFCPAWPLPVTALPEGARLGEHSAKVWVREGMSSAGCRKQVKVWGSQLGAPDGL